MAVLEASQNEWGDNISPIFSLSLSMVKSSNKYTAVQRMVEGDISIPDIDGRVTVRRRDDILHSYDPGCKIVTVNVYEQANSTAVECAHLETGFF